MSAKDRIYEQRWLTLAVLSLSLVIIGLDNTILNIAIPTLQQTFQASASELQWMVDSYILVFAGLLLTMGALGDRFGRARALTAGLIIFGAASAFAAYADSANALIVARGVMGIGGALMMPATLSIIVDVFPKEERGKAIAIWAAVAGLGIGLGPLLGGVLLETFWWGSVFLVNIPIILGALVLGRFLVPNSSDPDAPRTDIVGAGLSMAAVSAIVYSIIEAPSLGWTSGQVLAAFGIGVVALAIFVWWEQRVKNPIFDLAFFQSKRFTGGVLAITIAFFALFGVVFLFTQYMQFVKGYSPLEAGVRIAPIALGMAIGSARSHLAVRRFGTTRVVTVAMVALGVVIASLSTVTAGTSYVYLFFALVGMSMSMGFIMAPATDAVMGSIPVAKAGVGSATNDVTRQLGGALGVAIVGSAMNARFSASMADAVVALPQQAAEAASNSVGAAISIASQLPEPVGTALAAAANEAFLQGFGAAAVVATAVALVGAVAVAKLLPATEDQAPVPVLSTSRTSD
ncbi:MAG: DHA2 family efflux MFS transporter permease subunit [Actinobacteria bacterium]|nr:DHA2 family efflux MFS transporter permease subunit [Actinomycetota bacterium]